jgi:hypothetical protein
MLCIQIYLDTAQNAALFKRAVFGSEAQLFVGLSKSLNKNVAVGVVGNRFCLWLLPSHGVRSSLNIWLLSTIGDIHDRQKELAECHACLDALI